MKMKTLALVGTALILITAPNAKAEELNNNLTSNINEITGGISSRGIEQCFDWVEQSDKPAFCNDYTVNRNPVKTIEEFTDLVIENFTNIEPQFAISFTEEFYERENYDDLVRKIMYKLNDTHTFYYTGLISTLFENVDHKGKKIYVNAYYNLNKLQQDYVDVKVKEVADEIRLESKTDLDKVLAVANYVARNAEFSRVTNTSIRSPYTIFNEGKGNNLSYSLVTYLLLKELGVEVLYHMGAHLHAPDYGVYWNMVKLGDNYYHLDTFEADEIVNDKGSVDYTYILRDDSFMEKERIWSRDKLPKATDNKYEIFKNLTEVGRIGGDMYLVGDLDHHNLVKVNLNTLEVTTVAEGIVTNPIMYGNRIYYSNQSYYNNLFSYDVLTDRIQRLNSIPISDLFQLNGVLYFNIGNERQGQYTIGYEKEFDGDSYYAWNITQPVSPTKVWRITVSTPVDESSLTGDSVYVKIGNEKVEGVTLTLTNDKKTIIVTPPIDKYKTEMTHTLFIEDTLLSASKNKLNKKIKMDFFTHIDVEILKN